MRHLLLILFVLLFVSSFAQEKSKLPANLFIHFDKNVYSNNETAYFTAYLLREGSIQLDKHKVLALALIRNIDTSVVTTKKFIMHSGIATGNFEMPDSIQPGNYRLLGYTDRLVNGLPEITYEQPITLKTKNEPPFKIDMKIVNETKFEQNTYQVLIAARTSDNQLLPKPLNINYKYGGIVKTAKTDTSSQLLLTLPVQNNTVDPNLYVKISNGKDTTFMQMALPRLKPLAKVNFYPEGGHAVLNIPSIIAFEVKDDQNMPLALKALLFKDKKVVDTLETDSYGFGKFKLQYEAGASYTLNLVHDGLRDSVYQLPPSLNDGIVIYLDKAVVNDTLKLLLKSTGNRQINIRIHNFNKTFLHRPFHIVQNYHAFKVPLLNMPRGLLAITVSDSLDRPVAERIFFANYNNQEHMQLNTNRQEYKQREKVNLSLHLPDSISNGLVSIAVVQNNRLELKKMKDIESHTYLNSVLTNLPIHLTGLPFKDSLYLENVLLTKAWRKYQWEGLGGPPQIDSISFTAQVLKNKKALKVPMMVSILGSEHFQTANTSSTGLINLVDEPYISNIRGNLHLFVQGNSYGTYQVIIKDGFDQMSEQLKSVRIAEEIILPSSLVNNAELVLKGNEKAITLNEVVINNKSDMSFNDRHKIGTPGRNACGDYVCINNFLNCSTHLDDARNTTPIKGRKYVDFAGKSTIVYKGCLTEDKEIKNLFKFDFVKYAKEFYENDYQDPGEPAFFSTIYWNHGLLLKGKTADLSFYTSDITGKFRIVVQGILNNDVVYAEHFFEVMPKQNP